MRRISLSILNSSAKFLKAVYDRYAADPAPDNHPYQSLSPINNAVDIDHYISALQWALKNRKSKDIKNIALTGPYGSGKSSILRTFQRKNKSKDLSFLPISLATFKEESSKENGKGAGEDLLRLIELSILQQIFYHEEDRKIPDSRFKKIKNFKRINIWLATTGIMTMLTAIIYLFHPDNFLSITGIQIDSDVTKRWLRYISLLLVFIGLFTLILRSFRTLYNISINKLKIQSAEIEIKENINKSILNNHLDEILYFFEVTKYNVVIIEDLDRFEQTEIFTKLREINLLINNSEKIKREVVFVYAVRDEMFQDKDRTKFFDFIIPVIPVINASNSNEILKKLIVQYKYAISEELIEDVSLFIDDMRLLYNICNEYHIYHQNLDQHLNQTKLLAMIVYKNIHPKDFVQLGHGQGELYNVFSGKSILIKDYLNKLDEQINACISDIKQLESLKIKEKSELRTLYINAYIPHLRKFHSFHTNGQDLNFDTVIKDENFEYFMTDKMAYTFYNDHYLIQNNLPVKFADIEKKVDADFSYKERENQIDNWHKGSTEQLKLRIEILEIEKSETKHLKMQEVVAKGDIRINTPNVKQTQLLNILLRNAYIAEDYLDYISIFYPESITKEDRQFLLNIKGQVQTEFDFKLTKIDKLLGRLSPRDFQHRSILNFSLLDHLLINPAYQNILDTIIAQLSDQSNRSVDFIFMFIDKGINVASFIRHLCKRWHGIWYFIESATTFSADKKRSYLKLILSNAEIRDIESIAERSNLKAYIEIEKDILSAIQDIKELKSLIEKLNIKFNDLDTEKITPELSDFIYRGSFYQLTPKTIATIIKERGHYDRLALDTCNYKAVKHSGCEFLISYVAGSINTYIRNVHLKIDTNTKEPEDTLVELLNNHTAVVELRIKVIEHTNTIIKDIRMINNSGFAGLLLSKSRVDATWNNLIHYYRSCGNKIDNHLVAFVNNPDNISTLTADKIDIDNSVRDAKTANSFFYSLLEVNSIDDRSYEQILSILPYTYDYILFGRISKDKVSLLLKYRILLLSARSYLAIRNSFAGLHIILLEDRFTEFLAQPQSFPLDENDIVSLLNSSKIPPEDKKTLLDIIGKDRIKSSGGICLAIAELCLKIANFDIDKTTLKLVLLSPFEEIKKIELLNTKIHSLNKDDITEILNTLPEPYPEIAVPGKRPLLLKSNLNQSLAVNLQTIGYISRQTDEKNGIRISTFKQLHGGK